MSSSLASLAIYMVISTLDSSSATALFKFIIVAIITPNTKRAAMMAPIEAIDITLFLPVFLTPSLITFFQDLNFTEVFTLRSEEHTSELQSRPHLVCRLLLEKKKTK